MEIKTVLKLNIFTDETFTEIGRTIEVDKIKIPYRTAMYLVQSLDKLQSGTEHEIMEFCTNNTDKIDKIIKATFGVSEHELDLVDGMELIQVIKELYSWIKDKIQGLSDSKNVTATV